MQQVTLLLAFATLLIARGLSAEKLVCYVELWAEQRPSPMRYNLDNLPDETCDYLILLYLTLDAVTWNIKLHNGYSHVQPEQLKKAARARSRNPDMKVLLAVGGWEDGVAKYSDMISDPSSRKSFVESVEKTLDEYGLDGVELHWLYPGTVWRGGRAGDKENYELLVKELTQALKRGDRIVTASVPPDQTSMEDGFNVPRLNSLLHQMHLRTIDLRGDWNQAADNHCPLYSKLDNDDPLRNLNVNDSLTMWINAGASPKKLIPTYPLYGRSFTLRDTKRTDPGSPIAGPGKQRPFTRAEGLAAYYEICDQLQNKHWVRHYESKTETPYAVGGDQWIGYDDEVSLQKKIKWGSDRGLSGAALFAVSMDDFRGVCGQKNFLLRKVRRYLS